MKTKLTLNQIIPSLLIGSNITLLVATLFGGVVDFLLALIFITPLYVFVIRTYKYSPTNTFKQIMLRLCHFVAVFIVYFFVLTTGNMYRTCATYKDVCNSSFVLTCLALSKWLFLAAVVAITYVNFKSKPKKSSKK